MLSRLIRNVFFCLLITTLLMKSGLPAHANEPIALNNYALELLNQGEYDKALKQLQRAFSLNSLDENLKKNLAEAYAYVGVRHLEKNRYDEAVTSFDNARELYPDNSRYAAFKGIALYFTKRYDAAAYELERARLAGGDNVELLFYLGKVRYDTDNLTGALDAWEKALILAPTNEVIRDLAAKARRESAVENRMDKGYSSRFTITYDAEAKSNLADGVLEALETAYNRVGSDLDYFPTARMQVILYTKKDFRTVTASPDWSGGIYDGKIRLPIGGAEEVGSILKGVLFHEYTHVVVRDLAKGNCPTWLNEGAAEVEGRKEHNPPLHELPKAFKAGTLLPLSALEGSFMSFGGKQAQLAYEESYSMVNYLIATYGWYKVREIMLNLAGGLPIAASVAKTLSDYGVDYQRIELDWRDSLKKELAR